MQIVRDIGDLDAGLAPWRSAGSTIALVPTMGALHAGHIALVTAARRLADRVVATIFVNPTQFNDPADLARYPRQEEADLDQLRGAGCDAAWLPTAAQIYPPGFATSIHVAGVSERWEGEHRPGHFDGVATVVARLLTAARPDAALFGEKDWQQLAVIRRMASDLGFGIAIHGHPTVREADGLAMSSRNALLSGDERARAAALPRALEQAKAEILGGRPVAEALAAAKAGLAAAGFGGIDYVALVDSDSLEPLERPRGAMRLIAAASLGSTRLIDNMSVISDTV